MAYLPADPMMLMSFLNMKLRDEYASLADLCDDLEADEGELKEKLSAVGYTYDEENNQFI